MSYCPKCQQPVADGAKFCTNCGAAVEAPPPVPVKKFCTNCGAELADGSKFCANCGTPAAAAPVEAAPVEPAPAPQVVAPPPAEPVTFADEDLYAAAAVPEKKKGKGVLIAAIIAVVLVLGLGVSWALGAFDGLFEDDSRTSSSSRDDDEDEEEEDEDEDKKDDEDKGEDEDSGDEDETPAASESEPEPTEPSIDVEKVTLVVWCPEYDMDWVCMMANEFNRTHPEYELTVMVDACNEGDTGNAVGMDPAAAADIYMYSNEQLGTLIECGGLTRLGGSYLEQVLNDNSAAMVNSVTYTDGNVYGFPYTSNTWYMYYDKSVYSEEDIQSLETMLAKGVVAIPVSNSWYLGSFYAGAGATFFGVDGTQADEGIVLYNGASITHYLVDLAAHPNFVNDVYGAGVNGLAEGTVNAFFSGSWDANNARNILGNNMGVAPVPTITVDGETLQPRAFAGSKAIGVNPNCENQKAAMMFAAFLASPDAQLSRYEFTGTIPVSLALANDPTIANDPVAMAQLLTIQNTSILQPSIPEMACYWGPMNDLGLMIVEGGVNHSNADAITEEFEAAMNP